MERVDIVRSLMLLTSFFLLFLAPFALGSDPELIFDYPPVVKSAKDLKYSGLQNLRESRPGTIAIYFSTINQVPGLLGAGVSIGVLKFGTDSINSLHSHPRANELFYVISGELELGIVDTSNRLFTETLSPGDVFVFPKGLLHYQINRSKQHTVTAIASFSSSNGGRLSFPPAIFNSEPRIPSYVLEKALNLDSRTVAQLTSFNFSRNTFGSEHDTFGSGHAEAR